MNSTKIDSLEGLRGIMATWVWVTHVTTMATLPFEKHTGAGWILANGSFAVAVFVILSGFVISLSFGNMQWNTLTPTSYGAFLLRRGFRLFPIYLVALYLSVWLLHPSIVALQQLPWDNTRTEGRLEILQNSADYYWRHLILHTFLLHGLISDHILPSTSFAFMGQAWSLTLEWQFYLVAPFAVLLLNSLRLTHAMHGLILILCIVASKFFWQLSFLPSLLFLFAIGYFAQRFLRERNEGKLTTTQVFQFIVVELILLMPTGANFFAFLIWLAVFTGVIFRIDGRQAPLLNWLETRPMQWLGSISYSFYCLHMVVMYVFVYVMVVQLGVHDRLLYMVVLIPGTLIVSLAASHLTYRFVEKPMQRYGKSLASNLAARPKTAVLDPALREQ